MEFFVTPNGALREVQSTSSKEHLATYVQGKAAAIEDVDSAREITWYRSYRDIYPFFNAIRHSISSGGWAYYIALLVCVAYLLCWIIR